MIFVTVGTQLPFYRLVHAVDNWARTHGHVEVFAQIGPSIRPPRHIPYTDFISPARVDALMKSAELIISHAGMGSILTAQRYQRPVLVMPRKAALGEHRNDHQLATAHWLESRPGVFVAEDESRIEVFLDAREAMTAGPKIDEFASGPLVQKLAAFIGVTD